MNPSEVELATRLLARDQTVLSPLLESIQRKILQYTWLLRGQREDAEKVTQDTLLNVSQNWQQLSYPETQLLQHELSAEVEAALRLVPDTYRAVLLLRAREELSTAETAEILGLFIDATKQRLHRGRALLRRQLTGSNS